MIDLTGLNCYNSSVISVAEMLGIDYVAAFAGLWSETDFFDDAEYGIYSSKRLPAALRRLGLADERVPNASCGEYFVIGMDVFHIPWHRLYGHFHDPHYFYAERKRGVAICHDPFYAQCDVQLPLNHLSHAFEIIRFYKVGSQAAPPDLRREVTEVLDVLPGVKEELLRQIEQGCSERLIKLVTAMINNRHLFGRFLAASGHPRFTSDFHQKWDSAKFGLYKLNISKNKSQIINETKQIISTQLDVEMGIARSLIN